MITFPISIFVQFYNSFHPIHIYYASTIYIAICLFFKHANAHVTNEYVNLEKFAVYKGCRLFNRK